MLHDQMLDEIVCHKLGILAGGRPVGLEEAGRTRSSTRARGQHRLRRQVCRPDRVLQVADRSAGPRRHPHAQQGQDPLHRLRRHRARRRLRALKGWTPSWCPAASASAAPRARSPPSAMRARTRCPIWASASACSWRWSSSRAMSPAWRVRNSTEFERDTPHPVIGLITEWKDRSGKVENARRDSDLGGTMRLGGQTCQLRGRHAGARDLWRRGQRASSSPLRGQQHHATSQLEAAGWWFRRTPTGQAVRDDRTADRRASVVRRLPVPPGIHLQPAHRPSAVHRHVQAALASSRRAPLAQAAAKPPTQRTVFFPRSP
jgi:hypothetical protein